MSEAKYGDREVEYTAIGPDHEVIQAKFTGEVPHYGGPSLRGWGTTRREAVIDLLRTERDIRYAAGR